MTFAGQGAPLPPPPPPTDAAVGFTSASSVSSDGIIGKAMLEENLSSEMGGVISVQDNKLQSRHRLKPANESHVPRSFFCSCFGLTSCTETSSYSCSG